MKRFLIAIALLSLFTSCNDGDIIVTDFDFEDSTLQFCEGPNKFVIFATNNDDVNESISLEFTNSNITTDDSGKFITNTSENITFSLSGTNKVIYRIYNNQINGSEYFMSTILINISSTQPPIYPDIKPIVVPKSPPEIRAMPATNIEIRAP